MTTDSISSGTEPQLTDREYVHQIPLDQLVPNPNNPRRAFRTSGPDWDLFVQSITESGIIEPLIVRPHVPGEGNTLYEIVAGHRRHRGAEAAGKTTAPCIVRDLTDDEVLVDALIENLQRVDLDPVEEATGYFRLVERGMTQADMAAKVGRSAKHVSQRLQLLKAPAKVLAGLKKGVFSIEDALGYAQVDDKEVIEAALANIEGGYFPERALSTARREVEEGRLTAEVVKDLTERNIRVIVGPSYFGTDFYKEQGVTPLSDLGMKNSAKGYEEKDWLVAVVKRGSKQVTFCTDDKRAARQYAPKVAEDGTAKAEAEKKRAAVRQVREAKAAEDARLLVAVQAKVSLTDLVNEAGDLLMGLIHEHTAKDICKLLDLEVTKVNGFYDWKGAVRENVSGKLLIHVVHGLNLQRSVDKKRFAAFLDG